MLICIRNELRHVLTKVYTPHALGNVENPIRRPVRLPARLIWSLGSDVLDLDLDPLLDVDLVDLASRTGTYATS